MRRALALVFRPLMGLASPAWADKDKDKGGKGTWRHGGGPAVVVQPVRVIVPAPDRAVVYRTTAPSSPPAAARRASPRRAMAACRRARPRSSGSWASPCRPPSSISRCRGPGAAARARAAGLRLCPGRQRRAADGHDQPHGRRRRQRPQPTTASASTRFGAQCRKWRMPVKTMARPFSSAASITSLSRIEPPGWMTAVAPASAAASRPSANGKKASDATTLPIAGLSAAWQLARFGGADGGDARASRGGSSGPRRRRPWRRPWHRRWRSTSRACRP